MPQLNRYRSEWVGAMILLRDERSGLEAAIDPHQGAELAALRVRHRGEVVDLLYRSPEPRLSPDWLGHAPILWPAVGRNFSSARAPGKSSSDCCYDHDGQRYELPIHGFARLRRWRVADVYANNRHAGVDLVLVDDPATRVQYPFGFELSVSYRLANGTLTLTHAVKAAPRNSAPMFFSIGNHVTFRVPLLPGSQLDDITVESPSRVEYLKDESTLPTGETRERSFPVPTDLGGTKTIPSIALGGYGDLPWLSLRDAQGLTVRISHRAERWPAEPLVQFSLWGDAQAGYFSPEPWVGMPNSLNSRCGLVEVLPGEDWEWVVNFAMLQDAL